jgi:hypothetical protein
MATMDPEDRFAALEAEIEKLHAVIEAGGVNTRGDTDVFGTPFLVPVNDEHKATVFTTKMLGTAGKVRLYLNPPTRTRPTFCALTPPSFA